MDINIKFDLLRPSAAGCAGHLHRSLAGGNTAEGDLQGSCNLTEWACVMEYLAVIGRLDLLQVAIYLVTEGSGLDHSSSGNISLGSSLTPNTNSSWLSPSGLFAFGFYEQDDGFMVGIWLANKPNITVVWTANRDDPPVSSNSTIELTRNGLLLLIATDGVARNITDQRDPATSASMLDSGSFALYNHSDVIWESFDYPCDTILGGQNLTSLQQLVSSFSASQHSSGRFKLSMLYGRKLVAYRINSAMWDEDMYWSAGTFGYDYLNLNQTGFLNMMGYYRPPRVLNPSTRSTSRSRSMKNETVIFRATLNPDGNFVLYSHRFGSPSSSKTGIEWSALEDPCKVKGACGINSYCNTTTAGEPECHCFPGFVFFNQTGNGKFLGCYGNFTEKESCSRRGLKLVYNMTPLDNIELQTVLFYSVMNTISREACSKSCLDDCNCWASYYANDSCKMLLAPIIYGLLNEKISATVFIKTSFPNDQVKDPSRQGTNLEQSVVAERKKLVSILAITLGLVALLCTLMALSSFFFYRVHARRYMCVSETVDFGLLEDHFTLRSFSFDELQKATDGFKEVLGGNSCGEVYKGFISEGKKAVAVKRLESLFEGEGGFRAEITGIAQTHHRNLVRLLGFCIQGAKKLLVYEFMSNGSLADLLFNVETRPGWEERFKIALDVARGILYLHEECEARIIHCNIKPHNILFDESWTAKISDFGLSKLLRPNQSGTLTGVRGTRGYMAPEWHKNTLISTKVDIYSFGVVLLEILCCGGNVEIDISSDDKVPLCTWVYSCFLSKELSGLIGDDDEEEVDIQTLEKMVKVGLLCIQDDPDARPSIKNVILMLEGTTDIPIPPSPIPSLI
ncbi:hypothetical protein OSB04_029783 [Centaurea solstitialis]|uniref:Receptor-like serine/threonine-protein kinase n=1 Tax=Centaurea solstitialis TaxID=347529 RepID=A0AA38W375_9ASTR|nr:hypothetical protein OSB04_029783 [Centaurea solstitialis]